MAIFTSLAVQSAFSPGASMIDVFQDAAGSRVLRVYRIFQFNHQFNSGVSSLVVMQVKRITSAVQGGNTVLIPADPSSPELAVGVSTGTQRVVVETDLFRQYVWPAAALPGTSSAQQAGGWAMMMPFALVWKGAYEDGNIQPLTCRPGYGITVRHDSIAAVTANDFEIEFSDDSS